MKKNVRKPSATKKGSRKKKSESSFSYGKWGSVAAVCLLVAGGGWYITAKTTLFNTLHVAKEEKKHEHVIVAQSAKAKNTVPAEPEFDFYQILPNATVETNIQQAQKVTPPPATKPAMEESPKGAPVVNMTTPASAPATPKSTASEKSSPVAAAPSKSSTTDHQKEYYLQIISLTNPKDAESYKAKLILAGYSPFITKAYVHGNTWYRILVGPYSSSDEIKIIKAELTKDHYKSLLIVDTQGKIHE